MRSARSTCGEKVRQPSPATLNPVNVESNLVLRPRPPSPFLGCMIPPLSQYTDDNHQHRVKNKE